MNPARENFARFAARKDEDMSLAEGAALLNAEDQQGVDAGRLVARLTVLGGELERKLEPLAGDLPRLEALRAFLFDDYGLKGNTKDYYDPKNSYLEEVLNRRVGIPISLGTVLIEVGRRAGVPLAGVSFPGHFLVRHAKLGNVFLDPFNQGRILSEEDCKHLLDKISGGAIRFTPELLRPATTREILARMLGNLKTIYTRKGEVDLALAAVERILLLYPNQAAEYRDRGLLRLGKSAWRGAIADFQKYLELIPTAPDKEQVEKAIADAQGEIGKLN